jgi:hypothetical protein
MRILIAPFFSLAAATVACFLSVIPAESRSDLDFLNSDIGGEHVLVFYSPLTARAPRSDRVSAKTRRLMNVALPTAMVSGFETISQK